MAGRVGKKEAVKSAAKPASRKDGAARMVASLAVDEQLESKMRVARSVSKTAPLKKRSEKLREREHNYHLLADFNNRLNDVSISFAESSDLKDLFNRIAESFRLLTGSIVATFSICNQETPALKIVSLSADPASNFKIDTYFGPQLFEMEMPISPDLRQEMLTAFIRRPKDLVELTQGVITRDISDLVMQAVGCDRIVALAISHGSEVLGSCVAFLPEKLPVVPDEALKTFLHMAGLAIKRKQTEEALQKSEALYQLLADNTADGIWLLDMNLKLIYCSPSSAKQSGFTLREITEMSLEQYFTPESLKVVAEAFLVELPKVLADPGYNPILTLDLEFYKKDGTAFWAESKFSVIRDKHGEPESILGVARDITERRINDELLRKSEERFRKVFSTSPDLMSITRLSDGLCIAVNKSFTQLTGYEEEEIIGKSILSMNLWSNSADRQRMIEKLLADGVVENFEAIFLTKTGVQRYGLMSAAIVELNGEAHILNTTRDITKRIKAEEALRETEEKYRNLFDNASKPSM